MAIKIQGVSVLRDEIEGDTFNSTTDNLEAIRDEIVVIDGIVDTITTNVDTIEATVDHATWGNEAIDTELGVIDAKVDTINTNTASTEGVVTDGTYGNAALDTELGLMSGVGFATGTDSLKQIRDAIDAIQGTESYKIVSVTSAANAGFVTLGTVATGAITIQSMVIHADSASQTDLTSCGIYGGAGSSTGPIEFLNAKDAKQANLDAIYEQVGWTGEVYLPVGAKIDMNLIGGGATPVDLTVAIRFMATSLTTPGTLT